MNLPRFILTAGLLATLPILRAAEQPATPPPEETVVLPTFEVPGKFPAEGWVYARIGQTEFLSQLSEKQTRVFADDFAIFQEFVRARYPEAALPADQPVTVVLCNSTASFRQFGGSTEKFTDLLPHSNRFILIDASQVHYVERSIRRRWMDLAFNYQPPGKYPLWRQWAARELLTVLRINGDRLEVGYPPYNPHSEGGKIVKPMGAPMPPSVVSNQFYLMANTVLPLGSVFQGKRPWPEGADSYSFRMEATAFSHMCQFSTRHTKWREPYKKFVTRLEAEPYSAELFQECFGKSPKDMERLLRDYIFSPSLKYESLRFKFPPTADFEVREALPVEVLRLLRESQRLLAVAEAEKTR